jgi:uncharacterized glyoxalase superfamily protein PhnB
MDNEVRQTTPRPVITSVEPQLFVADIKTSCNFYTERLGFSVAFLYGDPPFYGQVMRDAARLNLRQMPQPVFAAHIRQREGLLSASLTVATTDEIRELFAEYQSVGVRFHQPLKKEPWGAITFIVSDPDGNLILFAGPPD